MSRVIVLRLGHRKSRDRRISTHVALVARAFGAEKIVYSGERDRSMEESVNKVVNMWGGSFSIGYEKNWKKFLTDFSGIKIHLTMYGKDFREKIKEIKNKIKKKNKDVLIIVGAEKVPGEVYHLSDYNLAIGNQPHSEVAALALFLYEFFERKIKENFEGARIKIIPMERGKRITKLQQN